MKKQGFFEEVASLSQILLPIKNTIKILESDNSTLADVFIQMIRLACKLKNINIANMAELKRHSICAFNKRWNEFQIGPYLLAYFLHPGYRGKFYSIYMDYKLVNLNFKF